MAAVLDWLIKFTSPITKPKVLRTAPRGQERDGLFTIAEIAEHNQPSDAWIIIDDGVYDVSAWGEKHPGGDVVYSYAGTDATDAFHALHKGRPAQLMMRGLRVGTVSDSTGAAELTPIVRDFRKLRVELETEGLMDASGLFYARKMLELVLMLGAGMFLLVAYGRGSVLARCLSIVCMSNFFHQCGWTTHDFLHNQVFAKRSHNTLVGGVVMNLFMGGSVHWWKTKHNQHHATPNRITEGEHAPVDPDIDTIPLIAWSQHLLNNVEGPQRMLISIQHILLWPLMGLAYLQWQQQSIVHLLAFPTVPRAQRRAELAAMTLHHLLLCGAIFSTLPFLQGAAYWLVIHAVSGFMTSFVFVQSHNGMEVYSDAKDFASAQLVSTRNIDPSPLVDWWCGGLNYQIEHHLFPMMPRHSFKAVRSKIMRLCKDHSLPYETIPLRESTAKVYNCLAELAAQCKATSPKLA
ncbi:MAG: hypothetical protein WDW38_009138 [Sanguina aurantia]